MLSKVTAINFQKHKKYPVIIQIMNNNKNCYSYGPLQKLSLSITVNIFKTTSVYKNS